MPVVDGAVRVGLLVVSELNVTVLCGRGSCSGDGDINGVCSDGEAIATDGDDVKLFNS
jgi:hypothetical protein